MITYAALDVLAWLLGASGVTHLPSAGYVAADLALDALIVVGLWFLWRPVWIAAVALTVLGEISLILQPARYAVLLVIGAAQLVLLLVPQLREQISPRATSRRRPG